MVTHLKNSLRKHLYKRQTTMTNWTRRPNDTHWEMIRKSRKVGKHGGKHKNDKLRWLTGCELDKHRRAPTVQKIQGIRN